MKPISTVRGTSSNQLFVFHKTALFRERDRIRQLLLHTTDDVYRENYNNSGLLNIHTSLEKELE